MIKCGKKLDSEQISIKNPIKSSYSTRFSKKNETDL